MTIKEKISNNFLEEALQGLDHLVQQRHIPGRLKTELILQKSRLNLLNRNHRLGLVTDADTSRERNRINYALLDFINELERLGYYQETAETMESKNDSAVGIEERYIPPKYKILFLGANPRRGNGGPQLEPIDVGTSLNMIESSIKQASLRDRIQIVSKMSVSIEDLIVTIVEEEPTIIHFSGHGGTKGIYLHGEKGWKQEVTLSSLISLLNAADNVEGIILSACSSEEMAHELANHLPWAIGMRGRFNNNSAISFASGFYKALGAGRDVERAFKIGKASVELEGLPYENSPQLFLNPSLK